MINERTQKILASHRSFRAECAKMNAVGTRMRIEGVDVIVHAPKEKRADMPVLFALHGGAWVGGDAVQTDYLMKTLADTASVYAVNVNYTKLDEKPYPNPLNEVLAVVTHFQKNSALYGIDPNKCVLMGCSAGAHLSACAAIMAKDKGIPIARQILVYPFLDWTGETDQYLQKNGISKIPFEEIVPMFFEGADLHHKYISPMAAKKEELTGMAPCDIIACGKDILLPHAIGYYEKLTSFGLCATYKFYENALHGFIEVNQPDHLIKGNPATNDEQAAYARDLEAYISEILRKL